MIQVRVTTVSVTVANASGQTPLPYRLYQMTIHRLLEDNRRNPTCGI
jgi:hypothetical protein